MRMNNQRPGILCILSYHNMIKRLFIGIILFAAVFIGMNKFLANDQGALEQIVSVVGYPILLIQKNMLSLYTSGAHNHMSIERVLKDNEELLLQRDLLSKKLIELTGFIRNLTDTQELRDYLKRFNFEKALYVPVLTRNFEGHNFFLIDAGETAGIKKNMIALCKESLIGKVTEVYPSYSKVLLITDPTCKVAAFCGSNGVKGIHEGYKKGTTTLNFVDPRDEVKTQDLVLSSGEGGIFPRGFGLGTITHSEITRYGRSIVITPLIDFKKIEFCAIVPNTITPIESEVLQPLNSETQLSDK